MLRWIKLLLLLCLLTPAWAQTYGLGPDGKPLGKLGREIEAKLLFPAGPYFSYDCLFPLVIEYRNLSSQAQYFQLEWSTHGIQLPPEYRSVRLEPKATKRLPLILPAQEAGRLYNLTINQQSFSTHVQGQSQYRVVGLLTKESQNLDYLRSLQVEQVSYYSSNDGSEPEYQVPSSLGEMDAEVFPQHWGELSSLNIVIAHDLNALNLGTGQLESLLRWVRNGGHLVLVSNGLPDEFQGSPLEAYLPISPETVSTDHGRLTVQGPLREGAHQWEGSPLLSYRDFNYGRVWFLGTPLVKTDILGQDKTEALWRFVFEGTSPNTNYNQRKVINNSILDNIPELPRTQAGWIALFVLLYGVAVGPINLSILRKKDKMLLAFVTVPIVAFFFAGSAYVVNRLIRPADPVLRGIGWAKFESGQKIGPAEAEQVYFSPHPGKVELTSDKTTVFDIARYNYRSRDRELDVYQVTPEGGLSSSMTMGTWDIQRLGTNSILELESPFEVTVNQDEKTVTITSPLPSDGKSAIVGGQSMGMHGPFELKKGTHTYPLEEKPEQYLAPSYSMNFDSDSQPGRDSLQDQFWNQQSKETDVAYLLFWTTELQTPLRVDEEESKVHHDYFVGVEFKL